MEISAIIPHIEALIFASEKPLPTLELVELINNALGFIEDRATLDQVESAMDAIREKYQSEFYPFEVKESGGGWQFLTKPEYHKTVAQLNGEKFLKRLSTAALETLSIIAYKQPVTKGEIENIRGVNCDYAVQKLLEKELVVITGRRENAPGQPLIYATSKSFMDYFGINSVDDLPKLKDIISSENVSATAVGDSNPVDEDIPISDDNSLMVNEAGDIEEVAKLKDANTEEQPATTDVDQNENSLQAEGNAPEATAENEELTEDAGEDEALNKMGNEDSIVEDLDGETNSNIEDVPGGEAESKYNGDKQEDKEPKDDTGQSENDQPTP